MAKKSVVERDRNRRRKVEMYRARRDALRKIIRNKELPREDRFEASVALAKLPRNSSAVRVRNRCSVTGRGRSYYRRVGMSRIILREYASMGFIPGMVKSSW